jgi:hypothetical protein
MVSAVLLPNAKACFITSAGLPAVGYKLYTYDAGTTTPRTTYTDAAGGATNTNPIILDARGEAVIYWDGSYKVVLKDASDVTIWTVDNYSQGPLSNAVPWIAAGGSADAITATYSPAITSLTDGLLLTFRSTAANATTTPTFAPNGLTARTIVKYGGQALLAGDIPRANYECLVKYNLANTRWELIDPLTPNVSSAAQTTGNFGVGTAFFVTKQNTNLGAGGTLDLTCNTDAAMTAGYLSVSTVRVSNGNFRTSTNYGIHLRGTTADATTSLSTANGPSGANTFTITYPTNGVIRFTDTSGNAAFVTMSFFGHAGG